MSSIEKAGKKHLGLWANYIFPFCCGTNLSLSDADSSQHEANDHNHTSLYYLTIFFLLSKQKFNCIL